MRQPGPSCRLGLGRNPVRLPTQPTVKSNKGQVFVQYKVPLHLYLSSNQSVGIEAIFKLHPPSPSLCKRNPCPYTYRVYLSSFVHYDAGVQSRKGGFRDEPWWRRHLVRTSCTRLNVVVAETDLSPGRSIS